MGSKKEREKYLKAKHMVNKATVKGDVLAVMRKHFNNDKVLPNVVIDDIVNAIEKREAVIVNAWLRKECETSVLLTSNRLGVELTPVAVRRAAEQLFITVLTEIASNTGFFAEKAQFVVHAEMEAGNYKDFPSVGYLL